MMHRLLSVSLAACLVGVASSASAQQPAPPASAQQPATTATLQPTEAEESGGARTHDGFYLRMGAGFGYLTTSASVGAGADVTVKGLGPAFQLSIGGTPVRGLVIAGTLFTHVQPSPSVEAGGASVSSDKTLFWLGLGPLVEYYIDPKGGLHFGASLLYSTFNGVNYTSTGFGGGLHGGYDFFFSDRWSVGPGLQMIYSKTSKDPEKDSSLSIALMVSVVDH
jgi:hypothetical protein